MVHWFFPFRQSFPYDLEGVTRAAAANGIITHCLYTGHHRIGIDTDSLWTSEWLAELHQHLINGKVSTRQQIRLSRFLWTEVPMIMEKAGIEAQHYLYSAEPVVFVQHPPQSTPKYIATTKKLIWGSKQVVERTRRGYMAYTAATRSRIEIDNIKHYFTPVLEKYNVIATDCVGAGDHEELSNRPRFLRGNLEGARPCST